MIAANQRRHAPSRKLWLIGIAFLVLAACSVPEPHVVAATDQSVVISIVETESRLMVGCAARADSAARLAEAYCRQHERTVGQMRKIDACLLIYDCLKFK